MVWWWFVVVVMQIFTPRSTPGYSYRGGAFRAERTHTRVVDGGEEGGRWGEIPLEVTKLLKWLRVPS